MYRSSKYSHLTTYICNWLNNKKYKWFYHYIYIIIYFIIIIIIVIIISFIIIAISIIIITTIIDSLSVLISKSIKTYQIFCMNASNIPIIKARDTFIDVKVSVKSSSW